MGAGSSARLLQGFNSLKVLMAALALAGITGMYLRQVTKIGSCSACHPCQLAVRPAAAE
jgi:hypothetical protein